MGGELNSLSLMDLRELAKQKGIKNTSKMNKDALIEAIMEEHIGKISQAITTHL